MASCEGRRRRNDRACQAMLYRCTNCGAVGCRHEPERTCTLQAFSLGRCIRCGCLLAPTPFEGELPRRPDPK